MITGWINSKGEVIETKPYQHFGDVDKVLNDIWKPLQEEIDYAVECANALIDAGEHPEWHNVEMTESDCNTRAYEQAYMLGYLRLSPFTRTGEQPMIAVQGLPQWIESHKYVLKELCDKYECRLKTFPAEIRKSRW
jgi:hypothetical protein